MLIRITIAALVALLLAGCSQAPAFRNTDVTGIDWDVDFELSTHTGKRLNTRTLHGKVVLIFFGYTHCPDICAPTLAKLDHLTRRLGVRANYTQVLFVTVDPAHDTPKRLTGFLKKFHPSFIGLTGSASEIKSITKSFKVAYEKKSKPMNSKVEFSHSGAIFIKDRQGKLRVIVSQSSTISSVEHDVRLLIRGR